MISDAARALGATFGRSMTSAQGLAGRNTQPCRKHVEVRTTTDLPPRTHAILPRRASRQWSQLVLGQSAATLPGNRPT